MFDTDDNTWSYLDPNPASSLPIPQDRSYHASVASEQPLPRAPPNISNVLLQDQPRRVADLQDPPAPNSYGTFFIHAGCLTDGSRGNDLWSFDLASSSWAELPAAPGKPRGGTSLALAHTPRERIYRYGGFDGETELGGQMDYLELNSGTFNDKSGAGQMPLSPRGAWQSVVFAAAAAGANNTASRPSAAPPNRSVAGLVPATTGHGRAHLLLLFGETSPSSQGHAGAGKFLSDVWSFALPAEGMTAASFADAASSELLRNGPRDAECCEVEYPDGGGVRPMGARGWFGAAACADYGGAGAGAVCVWGGLSEGNERLGDGWIVSVE